MRACLLIGKALEVLYLSHKGLSLENNLHKGSKPGQNRNCRNTERSENRMQDQTVYIWARYYPDYAERMNIMATWCMVHMIGHPDSEFSLVPKG